MSRLSRLSRASYPHGRNTVGNEGTFLPVQAAEEMGKVCEVKISMGLFLIEF